MPSRTAVAGTRSVVGTFTSRRPADGADRAERSISSTYGKFDASSISPKPCIVLDIGQRHWIFDRKCEI